jgi:hypothetical protein
VELPVLLAQAVLQEPLVLRVLQEAREVQALLVLVHLAQVVRVHQELQVHQEQVGLLEAQVLQEQLVLPL